MGSTSTEYKYLERDPKSSYRQLSIKGRRIRARTLYGMYKSAEEPMTVEEIAANYDLPVEAVREAIAYCETDPPEIRLDWEREEARVRASGRDTDEYKRTGRARPVTPREKAEINRRFEP